MDIVILVNTSLTTINILPIYLTGINAIIERLKSVENCTLTLVLCSRNTHFKFFRVPIKYVWPLKTLDVQINDTNCLYDSIYHTLFSFRHHYNVKLIILTDNTDNNSYLDVEYIRRDIHKTIEEMGLSCILVCTEHSSIMSRFLGIDCVHHNGTWLSIREAFERVFNVMMALDMSELKTEIDKLDDRLE